MINRYNHSQRLAKLIIGRDLESNEHVHHIDGDHTNDNPGNLLVVTARQHAQIHHGSPLDGFHWPGEREISDCELLALHIQGRAPLEGMATMPKPRLTRADLRIMKLG